MEHQGSQAKKHIGEIPECPVEWLDGVDSRQVVVDVVVRVD